jgi:hypothetical protein
MPISYHETAELSCPRCEGSFTATVWLILDRAERPDLVAALCAGELHAARCPHCGSSGPVGAPLLLHDGPGQQVLLLPAPDADEAEWREQGQSLLFLLIGSLPTDEPPFYLGQVQVVQSREALCALLADAAPAALPTPAALLEAVEALVAAEDLAQLQAVRQQHPALTHPLTPTLLAELADEADNQQQAVVADGLRRAATRLAELQAVELPAASLLDAVEALLAARDEGEVERLIVERPELLSDAASRLLDDVVQQQLAQGDAAGAEYTRQLQELLQAVRAQLNS